MQENDASLFTIFTDRLNQLNIHYMVTGSVASIMYGEPRMTLDVDLVIEIHPQAVQSFCDAFLLEEFYCPPVEVIRIELARQRHGHFNLIHHQTGFKADVYLKGVDPLHAWGFEHRRELHLENHQVWLAPIEYVIVRKLEFFKEGGSEKHKRDIQAMLAVSAGEVDTEQLDKLIATRGLGETWQLIKTNG